MEENNFFIENSCDKQYGNIEYQNLRLGTNLWRTKRFACRLKSVKFEKLLTRQRTRLNNGHLCSNYVHLWICSISVSVWCLDLFENWGPISCFFLFVCFYISRSFLFLSRSASSFRPTSCSCLFVTPIYLNLFFFAFYVYMYLCDGRTTYLILNSNLVFLSLFYSTDVSHSDLKDNCMFVFL